MSIVVLSSVICKPEVRDHASEECPPGVAGIRVVVKGEVVLSTALLFSCVYLRRLLCVCGETSTGVTMESSVLGGGGALITSAGIFSLFVPLLLFPKG